MLEMNQEDLGGWVYNPIKSLLQPILCLTFISACDIIISLEHSKPLIFQVMLKRGAFVLGDSMKKFNKKSLTAEEQVELLQNRGLYFDNISEAVAIIKRIGYYI